MKGLREAKGLFKGDIHHATGIVIHPASAMLKEKTAPETTATIAEALGMRSRRLLK